MSLSILYQPFQSAYSNNDLLPWWLFDQLPKSSGGSSVFLFGYNPIQMRYHTAWHVKPSSIFNYLKNAINFFIDIFPHTLSYRLMKSICDNDINEMKLVIDKNLDLNQTIDSKYGLNAISLAASLNRTALLQYLIFRGADINVQDNQKVTPLMHAINNWQFDAIKILVENGAKLQLEDQYGKTAVQRAQQKGLNSVVQYLMNVNQQHKQNLPKFKIRFDFQEKFADATENLIKDIKIIKTTPIVYPFNNLKGKYLISLINYEKLSKN